MGKKGIGNRLIVFGQINSGRKFLSGIIGKMEPIKLHGVPILEIISRFLRFVVSSYILGT